jgi:hypothetical protein
LPDESHQPEEQAKAEAEAEATQLRNAIEAKLMKLGGRMKAVEKEQRRQRLKVNWQIEGT